MYNLENFPYNNQQYIIKIKLSYQQFSWDKLIKQRNNPQLRIKKYYYIVLSWLDTNTGVVYNLH